jgi:type I restriction enzyme S subunit
MIFYKETNFKKEPSIGEIPTDWEIIKLGDESVSEIVMGQSPPSSTYNKKGIGLPFLQGKMEFGEIYPKALVYCSEPIKIAQPNDILISVRAPVGDVNLAPCKLCIGRGLAAIRFNDKLANYLFYFYYFQKIKTRLEMLGKGSTFKAIDKDDLESLMIPLPPVEEQRAIAGVLGVVDSVIAKTDEVIAKTERLKKGLMQTLLTRGIGHKEFKETEIGKIPKTWQVVKIKDVAEINRESIDPSKEMPNKTFLYVDIDSVEEGKIRNPKRILGTEAPSRARRVIHVNDVIMSTVRPYLKAFAIVPKELDNQICSTGFAVLSCKNNIVPYFLLSVLFSDQTISQCNRMMVGGQYPALNQSQVSEIKIPLPPLYEQQKIADIIWTVDKKLEFERNEKARLERIKRGLMDLLLTGKVRVKVNCGAVYSG